MGGKLLETTKRRITLTVMVTDFSLGFEHIVILKRTNVLVFIVQYAYTKPDWEGARSDLVHEVKLVFRHTFLNLTYS